MSEDFSLQNGLLACTLQTVIRVEKYMYSLETALGALEGISAPSSSLRPIATPVDELGSPGASPRRPAGSSGNGWPMTKSPWNDWNEVECDGL